MKIAITGATGFLGGATARRFAKAGYEVIGIGRNREQGKLLSRDGIKFEFLDLSDANRLVSVMMGCEYVIHCAALASPWGDYQKFYESNVIGTRNVVAAAIQNKVKRIVNISTPSQYFDYKSRLNIKESDPLPKVQATHYSATKLLADHEMELALKNGIEVISLRPRALFGPGDTTVFGRFMKAAKRGVIPLIDGGETYVDLTYIDNAVDAIELSLHAHSQYSGKIYNITNGEPIQSKELISRLSKALGLEIKTKKLPFQLAMMAARFMEWQHKLLRRTGEPVLTKYAIGLLSRSQTLDISAARTELGYSPKVSFDEGLKITAAWWNSTQIK